MSEFAPYYARKKALAEIIAPKSLVTRIISHCIAGGASVGSSIAREITAPTGVAMQDTAASTCFRVVTETDKETGVSVLYVAECLRLPITKVINHTVKIGVVQDDAQAAKTQMEHAKELAAAKTATLDSVASWTHQYCHAVQKGIKLVTKEETKRIYAEARAAKTASGSSDAAPVAA